MSESLLAACQSGDRAALERLFRRFAPQIYRWSVLLGLSPSDAEDAAQETLAIAARRVGACQAEGALPSWLFQINRRVVANARRTAWFRRVLQRADDPEDALAFEEAPGDPEQELAVRRCFRGLSRAHAEVLLLAGVEGHTVPEVSRMLGVPEGTVASRLRLARAAFQRLWEAK